MPNYAIGIDLGGTKILTGIVNKGSGEVLYSIKQKTGKEKDAEIERLKKLLTDNTITGNKNTVNSVTTSVRETLGLKVDDKDFSSFVDNITTEDSSKSSSIATYVSKIVNDAYEKGKKDATKDSMGNMGKGKGHDNQNSGEPTDRDKLGEFGKRLANMNKPKKTFDYFAQN